MVPSNFSASHMSSGSKHRIHPNQDPTRSWPHPLQQRKANSAQQGIPSQTLASCSRHPHSLQVTSTSASNKASTLPQKEVQNIQTKSDVVIELQNITKSFGKKTVLNNASIQIRKGEAVGIIGASGTGKSTIMKIMAGLLEPDSGRVIINGKSRIGLASDYQPEDYQVKLGMVFQSAALLDSKTVGENVGFKLYEHTDIEEEEIQARVEDSLKKVGLSDISNLLPAQLSGGMKKRVAIAQAIMQDEVCSIDQVILYDEPTAGLDPVASTVIEDLMRAVHNGNQQPPNKSSNGVPKGQQNQTSGSILSYVVVTHQHSTINSLDRLIFLDKGQVVWTGTPQEFSSSEIPIVKQFSTGSLTGPIQYN